MGEIREGACLDVAEMGSQDGTRTTLGFPAQVLGSTAASLMGRTGSDQCSAFPL